MLGGKKSSRRALWFVLSVLCLFIGVILLITGYIKNSEEQTDQNKQLITAGWVLCSIAFVFFIFSNIL